MSRTTIARARLALTMALFACVSTCPPASAQTSARRSVLTVHASGAFFPANPILDAAIREALESAGEPIDYYAEFLENDQFGADTAAAALAGSIRQKYRTRHIDLVIAITNDSLRFVLDHRADLFPDAPIVFAGLAVPDEAARRAGPGIAAVRVGSAYAETLKLALELHPSTERVFVVASSPNRSNVDAVKFELRDFSHRVLITFLEEPTLPELLTAVTRIPPGSLLLHIWQRENERSGSDPQNVARRVVEAARVPVYGTADLIVGSGVVGGVVRGTRETGTRAGQMALQILHGTRAQDIPVEDAPLGPIFDLRQVRRWGIDPAQLPRGSNIRFWTPSVWEAYRPYIIGTIAVVAAQLLAIAGLLVQSARRRRAEALVRASHERIRQLAGRVINAQEAARAGIARDLHDGVCQELAAVSIEVGSLKNASGQIQDAQAQQALAKIQGETLDVFEGLRRLSHELHPATLRLVGLATALQAHCTETAKRHGVAVSFAAEGEFVDVDPDVAVGYFRMAQEALRNGIVHGRARRLAVSLVRSNGRVELTVTDDGSGFDVDAARRDGTGLGLVSIEERAHALGGDAEIITARQQGTTVRVRGPAGSAAAP
jgi:signal transduction histidine kinase